LQQTLRDLATAYQHAFDPNLAVRFPRFKKRHRPQGIRFPQGFKVDSSAV
jgi:transposase